MIALLTDSFEGQYSDVARLYQHKSDPSGFRGLKGRFDIPSKKMCGRELHLDRSAKRRRFDRPSRTDRSLYFINASWRKANEKWKCLNCIVRLQRTVTLELAQDIGPESRDAVRKESEMKQPIAPRSLKRWKDAARAICWYQRSTFFFLNGRSLKLGQWCTRVPETDCKNQAKTCHFRTGLVARHDVAT